MPIKLRYKALQRGQSKSIENFLMTLRKRQGSYWLGKTEASSSCK